MRLSELENTIVLTKSPKGLISKIYTSLLYSDSSGYDSLKLLWERDLEVTFNPVDCKFFHRTYYTPVHLQKLFPDTFNHCYKCKKR